MPSAVFATPAPTKRRRHGDTGSDTQQLRFAQEARRNALFERLEGKLENDHLPWHDMPIAPKPRRPGLVILSLRRGLPVLEVKDEGRRNSHCGPVPVHAAGSVRIGQQAEPACPGSTGRARKRRRVHRHPVQRVGKASRHEIGGRNPGVQARGGATILKLDDRKTLEILSFTCSLAAGPPAERSDDDTCMPRSMVSRHDSRQADDIRGGNLSCRARSR